MSFDSYRPFTKRNVFPKYVIVFMFGISFALFFSSALTIVTGVWNAVQYIKQIVLTSDGTVGWTTWIVLDWVNQRLWVWVSNPNNSIQVKDLINFDNSKRSTFIWNQAWYHNTWNGNTAIWYQSLFNNIDWNSNTAIWYQSLFNNTVWNMNTAIWWFSLAANAIWNSNTAIWQFSLAANTIWNWNTAMWLSSLAANTIWNWNISIWEASLYYNTGWDDNVVIWWYSLYSNTIWNENIAIWNQSLYANIGWVQNVAIWRAAWNFSLWDLNVFLWYHAWYYETWDKKLYIANNQYSTLIYWEFDKSKVGINTTTPQAALEVNNTLRITPSNPGSDFCTMTWSIIFTTIGDGTNELCFCNWQNWMLVSAPAGWCFL